MVTIAASAPSGGFRYPGVSDSRNVVVGDGYGISPQSQTRPARTAPLLRGVAYSEPIGCGPGEVLNTDGTCAVPEVNRKIYVFAAKDVPQPPIIPPSPEPEVNIDVVFVKTPEGVVGGKPVVVPPPEQKTVVYVLSKRPTVGQEVIEFPTVPQEPEVFFVNYDEKDNPVLPGGISLQQALQQAAQSEGGIIDGGVGGKGFGHNYL